MSGKYCDGDCSLFLVEPMFKQWDISKFDYLNEMQHDCVLVIGNSKYVYRGANNRGAQEVQDHGNIQNLPNYNFVPTKLYPDHAYR